ncbi:TGF-beta-activated kinase 1 and MAP3K7-binding protein 1-like [Neocloeon triangulifer]|uniref:TGF-beta-activated kinase 1 and MAP3K7-binding protein 1-like n=1 Tax=Neocloeon triangulifer TaxID=2078957 RepID=UPI00286F99F4|nr:TGF-beta-activated kinase 1 and MAP3K7-binding protein 1-like [Neocloeon triangulifer]
MKFTHEQVGKAQVDDMPIRSDGPTRPNTVGFEVLHSWTDDLPVCRYSGVGLSTNQIYREDGYRQEDHEFEDRSFHFQLDDQTFLYGVFDGHDGIQAATFALQRTAAEILLGQLSGKTSDEEIKDVLRHTFFAVERGYFDSIDDKLAERTNLQLEIPQGLSSYEAYQKYPELVNKLKMLNNDISSGTTAVVALVYRGKLYVANVGDSRALLCKTDEKGVLRVTQLTVDHGLDNEDELLRLSQLGLDVTKICHGSRLGNQENTRCLGNYLVKGGYKEFEELACAISEPVIADPEINGGIPLDENSRFLLLMSDGLYKSLEEATKTEHVNIDIAQITVEQFRTQATLSGVAQAVVDKIVRQHHDMFVGGGNCSQRDDITLMVRNFNFPMPNALPNSPVALPAVVFNPIVQRITYQAIDSSSTMPESTLSSNNSYLQTCSSSETNDSSSGRYSSGTNSQARIKAYVDFSSYYASVGNESDQNSNGSLQS